MKKILFGLVMALASFFAAQAACVSDTLYLQGSQGKLFTIVDRPEGVAGKVPLVIICHGFNGNCREGLIADVARSVVGQGMAALRFDFNGHGRSEGEFRNMTVLNEIDDLKDVIAWAQAQPWVREIALVGHSQGGVVVSMTSGELGDRVVKAEVLLAAAAVLRDDAIRGNTFGKMYDPWHLESDVELFSTPDGALVLGKNYIETAINLPIYETASGYDGPALIIHGAYDRVVPYTYSERYREKIKDSTLRLIPGDDHGFSNTSAETALLVADWLKQTLTTND